MKGEKLFLVANPKSGRARVKTVLLTIVDILTRGGYSVTVYPTTERGDATRVLTKLGNEYSTVVCCGGDGTLNEVITGVMQNKNDYKIGYIPLGTLNEWSSSLKISRDVKVATADILTGSTVPLDIGMFGNSYFAYTASFGAFTSASYSAPQDVKNALGQGAYLLEGIKTLGNIKPTRLEFNIDGEIIRGDFLFGSISNSLSMGGIIKLDEAAVSLNDGLFEILLIENPDTLNEFNDILDALVKRDFNRKRIKMFKGREITVKSRNLLNWTLDGEHAVAEKTLTVRNITKAVNFIIPNK